MPERPSARRFSQLRSTAPAHGAPAVPPSSRQRLGDGQPRFMSLDSWPQTSISGPPPGQIEAFDAFFPSRNRAPKLRIADLEAETLEDDDCRAAIRMPHPLGRCVHGSWHHAPPARGDNPDPPPIPSPQLLKRLKGPTKTAENERRTVEKRLKIVENPSMLEVFPLQVSCFEP